VVERGQPILIRDATKDLTALGLVRDSWGTVRERSILVAPMRSQGQVIGAISVQSVKPNAYDEGDLELLGAIANEAAIAIERADLYERTTALSRRLFELHRIGVALSGQRDLPGLVKLLAQSVVSTIGASGTYIYLDDGGENLEFATANDDRSVTMRNLPRSEMLGDVLQRRHPLEVEDVATAPDPIRSLMLERDQQGPLCAAIAGGGYLHRRVLRGLVGAPPVHRRGTRAHRRPCGHGRGRDPLDAPVSGAGRRCTSPPCPR